MKYAVRKTSRYKKSLKRMLRRGKDIKKISAVVRMLANGLKLVRLDIFVLELFRSDFFREIVKRIIFPF